MGENLINRELYKKLFKQYFTPICNFVYGYVNDWDDAREISQNTFVNIWERRNSIKDIKAVKSYLFTTARNNALDFKRREKKDVLKGEAYEHIVTRTSDFSEEDGHIFRSHLKVILNGLKPKNKRIFELNKFEGLTYQEIADHMGISKRAVEENIARALKIIKKELVKTGEYD